MHLGQAYQWVGGEGLVAVPYVQDSQDDLARQAGFDVPAGPGPPMYVGAGAATSPGAIPQTYYVPAPGAVPDPADTSPAASTATAIPDVLSGGLLGIPILYWVLGAGVLLLMNQGKGGR